MQSRSPRIPSRETPAKCKSKLLKPIGATISYIGLGLFYTIKLSCSSVYSVVSVLVVGTPSCRVQGGVTPSPLGVFEGLEL